jgi:glyoxylase-like metal-dependent hydrolase (beta-lactamase superfamily II)
MTVHPGDANGRDADHCDDPPATTTAKLTDTLHYEDAQAEIHRVVVGPVDNNVFVLRCKQTGEAVLLDAANEHEKLLELCRTLQVRQVLETHGHWDHIQAVPAVRDAGYQVGVTAADAAMLPSYDFVLDDGVIIEVGRLRLETIATPGHTPGSMCFRLHGSPVLFSGDTLFPGGPGNTSFPGGDFATILTSIESRLFSPLPADTLVLPGHGLDTTIGTEQPHLQEWADRGW